MKAKKFFKLMEKRRQSTPVVPVVEEVVVPVLEVVPVQKETPELQEPLKKTTSKKK